MIFGSSVFIDCSGPSEIETVEETVEEMIETENATCNEESETSDIDAITKQDVRTQTNEIEFTDSSETEMNQQLIDLKSKLEKANQHIQSLQKQMFTVDGLEVMTPLSSFILVFQTGIHLMLFSNT